MQKIAFTSLLLMSVLASATSYANTYHAEVEAAAGFVDPDHGGSGSEYVLHGKYFFNPVDAGHSPLAESAFLDRASNVSVQGHFSDQGNTQENAYGAALEMYVPNTNVYVNASLKHNHETEKTKNKHHHLDTTYYATQLGYLPVSGLLVTAGLEGFHNDQESGVSPTLAAKYVTQIAGKDVNLEAGVAFGDLDEYRLAADYYLNKEFSVGADYYRNNVDHVEEYGIKARKFMTHQFSVEGRVGVGREFDNDYNSVDLSIRYHF